jgi:diamine N-acetyltransferase
MRSIRRAVAEDASALAVLAERTFRDTFSSANDPRDMEHHCSTNFGPEVQLAEIQDPDVLTLLVEDDGELIAFAQVRVRSATECVAARRPSELYRFYVSTRWHGRGTARELMEQVLAAVTLASSDRIWLGVWERNDRAIAFYRKFGFEVIGEHTFQLGGDCQRDLVMSLEIDPAVA